MTAVPPGGRVTFSSLRSARGFNQRKLLNPLPLVRFKAAPGISIHRRNFWRGDTSCSRRDPRLTGGRWQRRQFMGSNECQSQLHYRDPPASHNPSTKDFTRAGAFVALGSKLSYARKQQKNETRVSCHNYHVKQEFVALIIGCITEVRSPG